jgi:hypothetical protein
MRSPLKVPKKAETERGGILQPRIFWRQWSNDNATRRVEKADRAGLIRLYLSADG